MVSCKNCKFYKVDPNRLTQGFCHLNPPQLYVLPTDVGINLTPMFVPVRQDMCCGKGEPRLELAQE